MFLDPGLGGTSIDEESSSVRRNSAFLGIFEVSMRGRSLEEHRTREFAMFVGSDTPATSNDYSAKAPGWSSSPVRTWRPQPSIRADPSMWPPTPQEPRIFTPAVALRKCLLKGFVADRPPKTEAVNIEGASAWW